MQYSILLRAKFSQSDETSSQRRWSPCNMGALGNKKTTFALLLAVAILAIALVVVIIVWRSEDDSSSTPTVTAPTAVPANSAAAQRFSEGAVTADSQYCADIGRDILKLGGSAVDGAIAALICCGVVQVHSTGIGGGGFMTVYNAITKEAVVIDYRETGPAALRPDSYDADHGSSLVGGMAVGVPGEVRGLREAWKRFGKLSWRQLIQPSINLARSGTTIGPHMRRTMGVTSTKNRIFADPGLKELLVTPGGELKDAGAVIKNEKYAKTLEIIRDDPEDLYTGNLSVSFINDVRAKGGVMTAGDLKNYTVKVRVPLKFKFGNLDVYTTPLPGGGTVLGHILNMAQGYSFDESTLKDMDSKILTYHRLVEIFKFSYAIRPMLGDPDAFSDKTNITEAANDALNMTIAQIKRRRINDTSTQPTSYYSDYFVAHDSPGTTHVSILDKEGNAVAATDTINYGFGAKFRSMDTGIIYNNEMADFFHNGTYEPYPVPIANRPGPGKRPLSSTCPSVAVDQDGVARMVIGASGGTRITLSTAWVMLMNKFFGVELGEAVNLPRPQHTLFPTYIRNEKLMPMDQAMIKGLEAKNHEIKSSSLSAIVQAIVKDSVGAIYAKADPRKDGGAAGI